jgi:MFS family permease
MQIILPDFIADMRELPLTALASMTLLGFVLWSAGWWGHRFWMGLLISFGAGLVGLRMGPDWGLDPMAAGLLLAVAGGSLALAICRVGLFAIYGLASWQFMQAVAPKAAQPIACIVVGGVLAVLLYRFAIILLTSAAGAWVLAHGGLLIAEQFAKFDAADWVTSKRVWVNIGFAVTVFAGVIFQFWADRRFREFMKKRREWLEWKNKQQGPRPPQTGKEAPKGGWLPGLKRAA